MKIYHPDDFGLSYHESAHAVAAALLGHRFESVVSGNGNGRVKITNGEILRAPHAMEKNVRDVIKIFVAGQIGDEILHGKKLPIRSEPDFEVIASTMKRHGLTPSDFDKICDETKTLLKKNWRAVKLVAEGLRNNNVVTFEQVKQIINQ